MPINKVLDKNGKPVKKDGKQKYRVRINYTDNNGTNKQIERTAYGADEAKQIELELTHQVKEATPAEKITVNNLYSQYIAAKKHEVRETSLNKSIDILNRHVLPYLGDCKLNKLNVQNLQLWKNKIESLGLGITMRKNIYSEFRALLYFGVKLEYLSNNPLLKVGNFKAPLEKHKEMLYYTPEEFKLFISIAHDVAEKSEQLIKWNLYVFFNIAFLTGARKGEINALTWNDIKDGEICITKSVTQKMRGGDRITPPKNRSSVRNIGIPKPLKIILDEHYNRCKNFAQDFDDDYFICGGIIPLRDTTIENANRKYALAANVKHIRIHDFRHSHASFLANNGINIQEIARRLGHSDIKITLQTYSHLYPKESERALSVLDSIDI